MLNVIEKDGLLNTLQGVVQSILYIIIISFSSLTRMDCRLSLAIPGSDR